MNQEENCWICGRNSEDINSILGKEDSSVKQLKKSIDEIKKSREEFMNKSNQWIQEIPEVFKDMDYMLFIENPDQFKVKISFLDGLLQSHYAYTEEFSEISNYFFQDYDPATNIKDEAPERYDSIYGKIKKIPQKLIDIKLPVGIKYLQNIVDVKYEFDLAHKEIELKDLVSKKPDWASIEKYVIEEKRIPLCTVCWWLIIGLSHSYHYGKKTITTVKEFERKKKEDEEMRRRPMA